MLHRDRDLENNLAIVNVDGELLLRLPDLLPLLLLQRRRLRLLFFDARSGDGGLRRRRTRIVRSRIRLVGNGVEGVGDRWVGGHGVRSVGHLRRELRLLGRRPWLRGWGGYWFPDG